MACIQLCKSSIQQIQILMKIGILSMQEVKNYGSFLQAFSLKSNIEALGHRCEFVNIVPGEQLEGYRMGKFHKLALLAQRLWGWDFMRRMKYIYRFQSRFAQEFLPELGVKKGPTDGHFDTVVIGSDEVFNCAQKTWFGFSRQLFGEGLDADKIITLSKTGSSPIADSLYPYMIRNKNFKLVKRILLIFMPVICFFVCLLFIYAESICIYIFGNEYADTANILRCLLPIMVVILPTYIICFPVMVPLGLSKYANKSNSVGVALQICGLIILWAFNNLTIYNLCILTSISEIGVFLYRISIIVIYKYKPKILKYRTLNIKNSRSL